MPAGRPPKIQFDETILTIVENLAKQGSTDEEIAQTLGIHPSTFYRYQAKLPELRETIKKGKSPADDMVEQALFARALGFSYSEEVATKSGHVVTVKRNLPPDVTAMIFWLKNRRPEDWRDRQEIEHSGETKLSLHAQIVKAMKERDGEE